MKYPLLYGLLILCYVSIPTANHAQFLLTKHTSNDSIIADKLYANAVKEKNIQLFLEAGKLYFELKNPTQWRRCYQQIGFHYYYGGQPDIAIAYLDTFMQKIWWEPDLEVAIIEKTRGFFFNGIGKLLSAKTSFENAKHLYSQNNIWNARVANEVYITLANIYLRLGEYERARVLLEKALPICIEEEQYNSIGKILNNLGITYGYLNQNQKAVNSYYEALQVPGIDSVQKGILWSNITEIQSREDLLVEAFSSAKAASNFFQEELLAEEDKRYFIGNLLNLAGLHAKNNEIDLAENYYQQSLVLAETAFTGDCNREKAKIYVDYADFLYQQTSYSKALDYFQQALTCLIPSFSSSKVSENPNPTSYFPENIIMAALDGKGECFRKLAQLENKQQNLEFALSSFEDALSIADSLRNGYDFESSSLALLSDIRRQHESAIATAYDLHELTGEQKHIDQAFYFAERSKALLLFESIKDEKARTLAGVSEEVLLEEKALRRERADLEQELFFARQAGSDYSLEEIQGIQDRILTIREQERSLREQLEAEYPAFRALSTGLTLATIQEVQQNLKSDAMLVEYFLGDSSLFIFSVSPATSQLQRVPLTGDFVGLLSNFLNGLTDFPFAKTKALSQQQYIDLAHQLYATLLGNVLPEQTKKSDTELIIIPDGQLGFLPFEALLRSRPEKASNRYESLDYLLFNCAVRYEYSASVLLESPIKTSDPNTVYGGFAPVYAGTTRKPSKYASRAGGENEIFFPLTYNREEVEKGAALLGGVSYQGPDASESVFREFAQNYRVLQLAMHALVNHENPMLSKLVFTQTEDSAHDNFLYAHEIYNLDLNANLVILSACNSGTGKLADGEGIMSLARAFKEAGCPNIVMSLWNVNDFAMRDITDHFARHLKDGMGKAQALRSAKIDYLQQSGLERKMKHPYYWATCVLIGDNEPITPSNWPKFLIAGLILLAAGGLGWKYFFQPRQYT